MPVILRFIWQDNNGKTAQQRIWLPDGEAVAASIGRANAIRDAARPISSAMLLRAELEYPEIVPGLPDPAAPGSDVRKNLVVFYRDNAETASIRFPSPAPSLPYDTSGPWAGLRITRDSLITAGLVDELELISSLVVMEWGDPFPVAVSVAGIDFVV